MMGIFLFKMLLAGLIVSFLHWITGFEPSKTDTWLSIAFIAVAVIFEEVYRIRKSLERIAESGVKLPENVKINSLNIMMKKTESTNDQA